MSKCFRFAPAVMALAGLTAFGCGSSSSPAASPTGTGDDLSDSASALQAKDMQATFDALARCKRNRDRDADAGIDEGRAGRRPPLPPRRGFRPGPGRGPAGRPLGPPAGRPIGRPAVIARGLDQLLAVADLDALKKCQDIEKGCATSSDAQACRTMVETCVQPVLSDAFKALCEDRTTECKKDGASDQACKGVERACSQGPGSAKQ